MRMPWSWNASVTALDRASRLMRTEACHLDSPGRHVQAGASELTVETWLADEDLVTAVHSSACLCLAYKQTIAVVHVAGTDTNSLTRTSPPLLPQADHLRWVHSIGNHAQAASATAAVPLSEQIMTIAWIHVPVRSNLRAAPVFRGSGPLSDTDNTLPECIIVLGTSSGHIQLHDPAGHLLHRQRLHSKAVGSIQSCSVPTAATIQASPRHDERMLVVTFEDAVCSISSAAVLSVLRHVYMYVAMAQREGVTGGCPAVAFEFVKWTIPRRTGARADSACIPCARHLWQDLVELDGTDGDGHEPALAFVSVGSGPAVAMFEATDAEGSAVVAVEGKVDVGDGAAQGAFLTDLVNNVAGMVLGKPVDAAADVFGLAPPGCHSHGATIVNAIIGAGLRFLKAWCIRAHLHRLLNARRKL